jgi:hypothetical protein
LLSVELLRRSVAVEVDRASVVPVERGAGRDYRSIPAAGAWMPSAGVRQLHMNSGD